MPHPLTQKIVALRRRVRRLAAVYALSVAVVAWLGAVFAIGAADYWLRFEDRGLRLFASLAVLSVAGWSLWRWRARSRRHGWVTANWPGAWSGVFPPCATGCSSAVEFLARADNDPAAGSAVLRRELIARVTAETRNVEFAAVLDRRPALRAVAALTAGLLLCGAWMSFAPALAQVALARLANPFGETPWPRATHLAIRQASDRVARGETFSIEAFDACGRGCRPRSASIIASRMRGRCRRRNASHASFRPVGGRPPRRLSATVRLPRGGGRRSFDALAPRRGGRAAGRRVALHPPVPARLHRSPAGAG